MQEQMFRSRNDWVDHPAIQIEEAIALLVRAHHGLVVCATMHQVMSHTLEFDSQRSVH